VICVVLRVLKKGSLAIFLTEKYGKVIAHYSAAKDYMELFPGALVSAEYAVLNTSKYPFLKSLHIVCAPRPTGLRSYYFLQFFLDAVYFFLPQGQPAPEVFEFMQSAIDSDVIVWCERYPFFGAIFSLGLLRFLGFFIPESLYTLSLGVEDDLKKILASGEPQNTALHQEMMLKYAAASTQIFAWVFQAFKEYPQSKKIENLLITMRNEKVWG
jgi:hypothetical protein